jgi:hypothetical protein
MDDYSLTSSPPPSTFAYCSLGVDCKFAVPYYKKNLIYGKIFENKKLLNIECVLIISTAFSETFLILRRNEQNTIKMYIGIHVQHPFFVPDFN